MLQRVPKSGPDEDSQTIDYHHKVRITKKISKRTDCDISVAGTNNSNDLYVINRQLTTF